MARGRTRFDLGAALYEGLAFFGLGFGLGFFGSEALLGPDTDAIPLAASLVPGLAAAASAFIYRLGWPPRASSRN